MWSEVFLIDVFRVGLATAVYFVLGFLYGVEQYGIPHHPRPSVEPPDVDVGGKWQFADEDLYWDAPIFDKLNKLSVF
jgi:hypothetical protein